MQFLPALLGWGKASPYHSLAREEHHVPAQSLPAWAKMKPQVFLWSLAGAMQFQGCGSETPRLCGICCPYFSISPTRRSGTYEAKGKLKELRTVWSLFWLLKSGTSLSLYRVLSCLSHKSIQGFQLYLKDGEVSFTPVSFILAMVSTKVGQMNESVFLGAKKNAGEERDLDLKCKHPAGCLLSGCIDLSKTIKTYKALALDAGNMQSHQESKIQLQNGNSLQSMATVLRKNKLGYGGRRQLVGWH